jgi:hypothetical protein
MSAFKAQAHMRELVQRLKLSIKDAIIKQAQDADGLPAIRLEKGSDAILVKIKLDGNAGRVDGLGLPQRVYSPHICQLLQDADQSSADSKELKVRLAAAVGKLGMKVEVYERDLADLPQAEDFSTTSATLVAILQSDEINPLIQSQ